MSQQHGLDTSRATQYDMSDMYLFLHSFFFSFEGTRDPKADAQRGSGGRKGFDALHGDRPGAGGQLGRGARGQVPADGEEPSADVLALLAALREELFKS